MSGKYYIDEKTERQVKELVTNKKGNVEIYGKTDISPSQSATVILDKEHQLYAQQMKWGVLRYDGKGVFFSAKAERISSNRMYRESILCRRCIIPAKGFYLWDSYQKKYSFERSDEDLLLMAGCYIRNRNQERFVILSEKANGSILSVANYMPMVIDRKDIEKWVINYCAPETFFHKPHVTLVRKEECA